MHHRIRQYTLESGALEIQWMEEDFDEFQHKKGAEEVVQRLRGRRHLILMALASNVSLGGDGVRSGEFQVQGVLQVPD